MKTNRIKISSKDTPEVCRLSDVIPTAQPFTPVIMTNRRYHSLPLLTALILAASMVPQKSVADVLTFQQGVGGYTGLNQTTLFQNVAGTVNGGLAAGTWTVDGGNSTLTDGFQKHGLIWFDNIFGAGVGQIPLGSTITSATITANYDDPSVSSFAVYRMLQTWSPSTATWTSFTNGVQNDGTEAAVAATTTFSNPNSNAAGVYNAYGTSLTADLALFSAGTSNFGWVVLPTAGVSGWGWTAAQTNTPVLSVTFTPPSGGGPSVTLGLTGSPMAEAAGVATVTATLSGTSLNSVTVNLAYSGTATPTTDYTASANSIVIAPGNLTGTATLTAVQDSLYENPNETIIVDISTVTNGTESGVQQVTATIANDDPVSNILLSQNFSSDPVNYTLPLNSDFRFDTTPRYWAKSDTPTLIVNAGITGANGTYLGTQNLDSIADRPFSSSAPAQIDFTLAASAYTNLRLSIALAGMPMAEDVNFIRAKTDTNGDGTYETTLFEFKGTAIPNNQPYTDTVLGALTAAFQTFSNIALPAPTHPDGMLRLRLESYNDTDSLNEATGIDTIVITGDPVDQPSVTLALTGSPMAEAAGAATVTATLSATSASAVTVNLAYSGTATLTDDYTRSGTSIVIPAGSTTGTVTLTAVQDLIYENPDETIMVDIDTVTNGTESGSQQVTAAIANDDPVPPSVTLALSGSPMAEAAGEATVTATLSATSASAVTVNLAFSGTATISDDYTRSGTSIVIAAGDTTGTVTLTAVQDSLYENPDETVIVDIDTLTNGIENTPQQVTATIADDDPAPPTVTLALTGSPMAEAAGEATVTATLSETSASAVTVNLAYSGTAGLTDDYTRTGTSIVIAAGDTTGTGTLTAVQDSLYENPDETIVVDISSVTNAAESGVQQVTATITDDDPAPSTVTLAVTGSAMAEAAGVATVTATLSATSANPVTVNLAFSGTATLTTDYTRSGTSIVIAAGDTTGTVTLTAVQDSLYENPDETIIVDVSSVVNGTESGSQQVTASIVSDDYATVEYEAFSNGAVNTNSVLPWSHTVGGLAGRSNRMLVVGVSTERGSTSAHCSANTVTFGSQSMTRVTGSAVNSSLMSATTSFVGTELWYLPNPTIGTATITVTFADSQTGGIMGGAMSFAGVKQSAPQAVAVTADPITGTISYPLNITTPADGAVLVDIGSSGSSANDFTASPTPPMNRTWTQKLVNSASMSQGGAYRIVPTAGTVTDTWTIGTASRNSHAIAAFVPAGPTIPPTVALTAPTGGATVFVPGTTALAATANDADGTVSKVEFFDGATKLGEDLNAPFNFVWTPVGLGAHSLTAKATDNGGNTTTSTAVNVTAVVNPNQPPVITLTAPANLATITGSSTTLSANIIDPEGDAQTVTFYGRQTAPVTPGPDFTFIAIPDTQFYSEDTGRNAGAPSNSGAHISYFNDQTQWITANRVTKNIAFVAHMGDMVQNGDSIDAEWVRASGAMGLIENPLTTLLTHGIPWGGAPGNHDFGTGGGTGTTTKWNQYFGTTRWAGRTYFRGNYGSDNNNNYQFFSAGGLDFIVINIAYRTTADTAVHDWADALLKANPNRRAIVTSHWIVNTGNPATFGGQGQAIYDNLKDNPNLFLLLCGHVHGEGRRSDVFQTRTVHSVLQDYQDAANGGNGFLRTFTFSPATNLITAEMWSPTLNRTATTADASTALGIFTLPYNMQGAITDWIPLGTVNVPANGTTASLDWTGLEIDRNYEWYATANDSVSTVSSATSRFTIATGIAPTVSITAPANNAVFAAPATVNIAATANDPDGSVTKVEFYRGATKLGEDTTAPYEYIATGQAMGSYTLTAVATDNQNYTTTSAGIAITVSAPPSSGTLSREPYLNQNNQNSVVVRWRSSQSIVGRVRYGDSPTNLTNFTDEAATATNHVVKLTGLAPYTRYYYSVGSAFDTLAGGDADHTFRTSPVPGTATDTRVWVVGDCGRGNQFQRDVRDAYYAWTGTRTPDLCLMLGDNAYNTGTDAEYKTGFFDIYPTTFRKMPLWSTLGNHDANIDSATGTTPYFDMFTFPTQGECGGVNSGTEYYYSFDYGNIHVVNLDSQVSSRNTIEANGSDGPMAAWLRLDLAATTKTWIVVTFHHPPYSKGSHDSDTESQMVQMRTNFGPILEAGGADLVLLGHSHAYERSKLIDDFYETPTLPGSGVFKNSGDGRPTGNGAYIKPLTGPRDHFGAVYAVAGSAGSADGGSLNHPVMYVSYNTGGTLNLDINGNRLDATYIQKGVTNGTFTTPDTFTIIKQGAADSDSDGIPDAYELVHGLNRFNPADAALDSDGDGTSNLDEFVFDTAANASDNYAFTTTYNPNGTVTVSFPTVVGRSYRVNYSNTLLGWLPGSAPIAGTGATMTWTDDGTSTGSPPSNTARRFYQIAVTVTP